jgi:hypothetical protein
LVDQGVAVEQRGAQQQLAFALGGAAEAVHEIVDLDPQDRDAGRRIGGRQYLDAGLRQARLEALGDHVQGVGAPAAVGVGAGLDRIGVVQAVVHALAVECGRTGDIGDDQRRQRGLGWRRARRAGRRAYRTEVEGRVGRAALGRGAAGQHGGGKDGGQQGALRVR